MTTNAYMMGWLAYVLGSLGVLVVLWYLTRPLMSWLKTLLWGLATAVLLTPWPVAANQEEWAPAWVVSLFDGLFAGNDSGPWRAVAPLVAVLLVAFIVALLESWRQRRKAVAGADEDYDDD